MRVDFDDDDALIDGLILAAREWAEHYTMRAFVVRTVELRCTMAGMMGVGSFQGPLTEVISVTVGGVDLPPEEYSIRPSLYNDMVMLSNRAAEPFVARVKLGDVAEPGQVPGALRAAMQLVITDWYEKRNDSVRSRPTAAENLLNTLRQWA